MRTSNVCVLLTLMGCLFGLGNSRAVDLYRAVYRARWGYIDNNGEWIIQPTFVNAHPYSEGLAAVSRTGVTNEYIDERGRTVISVPYRSAHSFREGRAIVSDGRRFGYIAKSGALVVEVKYDSAEDFEDGVARVGVRNWLGNTYLHKEDSRESDFSWMYIDDGGAIMGSKEFVPTRRTDLAGPFPIYVSGTVFERGGYQFIATSGQLAVDQVFDHASRFSSELAVVMSHGDWGTITANGKWLWRSRFASISRFANGQARASVVGDDGEHYYGSIDTSGEWIVEPTFVGLGDWSNGLAPAQRVKHGMYGYINETGHYVIPPMFDYAAAFIGELAEVSRDKRREYISRAGQSVWREAK